MIGLLGLSGSFVRAAALTGMILLAVAMSMLVSRLLSATALRGMESSFLLELPPYRRPQIGQVLVRSVMDRTLFVLGRAAAVAAPRPGTAICCKRAQRRSIRSADGLGWTV